MLEAIFNETIQAVTLTGLTQWDYGQKLYIKGLNLPEVIQVHFSNDRETEAIVRVGNKQGEHIVVDIPNELLEKYYDITAWIYVVGENSGETIRVIYLKVDSRKKPQDFISHNPSAEDLLQDLIDKVNQNITDNAEFKKDITEQQTNFEKTITKQQNDFETAITNKQNNFETEITERQESFEQRVENKTGYTREEADERFIPTALQGTYTTDLAEEYKGVASDYGAEILKIEGKSEQATTKGYQLFDASKLPTKTQGGATVTNNGDGSFTVSGSGNLSEIFNLGYTLSHEESIKLLNVGTLTLKGVKKTFPYFQVKITSALGNIYLGYENNTVQITQAHLDDQTMRIGILFYGETGKSIVSERLKPMLYQDGDGTWEQFTGGIPSPNPSYPQEIRNALDKSLVSVGRNLFDASRLPTKSQGGATVTNNGDGSFTVSGSGNLTDNYYVQYEVIGNEEIKKLLKVGMLSLKTNDAIKANETNPYFHIYLSDKANERLLVLMNGNTKEVTQDILNKAEKLTFTFWGSNGDAIQGGTIKPMLYQEGNGEWEPLRYAETPLKIELRSLPDGTCDTYDNGVITRRVGVVKVDGNTQFASLNTEQNIAYLVISEYSISENKFFSGLCDKAKVVQTWNLKPNEITIIENPDLGGMRVLFSVPEEVNTLELLKAYFTENPMTVYYPLKTPTTEKVELPIVPTFYPYTNIFQSDDVKAKIQYGLRSKADYVESNMNAKQLLINNDFQVNQRGLSVYDNTNKTGYTVDMWLVNQLKVSVLSDGWVKVENLHTSPHLFQQKFGFSRKGKYAVALNVRNIKGEINLSFEQENGTEIKVGNIKEGRNEFTFDATTIRNIAVGLKPNSSIEIEYFDLFEGDVVYNHKTEDYAIALLKCQSKIFTICNSDFAQTLNYFFGNKRRSELTFSYLLPTKMTNMPTMISELGKLYSLNTESEILPNKLSIRFDMTNNQIVRFFIKKTDNSVFPITDDYQILLKKLILTCEPA